MAIERVGDAYQVTDLESTNGTCVNETRVTMSDLQSGDRVQFGSLIYKFFLTNDIELQDHKTIYSVVTRDGLTGVLNKRYFLETVSREFRRAVHLKTPLSLILFDIDHFKSVNDKLGHVAGDEVLQGVVERVGSVIAGHDVFARYGGEEFAILVPGVSKADATKIAERCRAAVENKDFKTAAGPLPVRISVGVADVESLVLSAFNDEVKADLLVEAADKKLYEAKHAGRNRVCS